MNCDELTEYYEVYALGALDGPEKEAIEEHLGRNCPACMKGLGNAVESNAYVYRAVPKIDPPARLRGRILAGFGVETRPWWIRSAPWLVAAASVAALFVTLAIPRRGGDDRANAMEFLSTPGTRQVSFGTGGPHGSILMHQTKGMLMVVVNLPAAPAGKMYETWIVPRAGAPKPVGQLKIARNGDGLGLIPGPLDISNIQALAVSVEPDGSKPVKPTQVVFAAPIGT